MYMDIIAGITEKIQKLHELGKSCEEKQALINVSEVFYIWDIMVMKMDILETVRIMENLIGDNDLKFIAAQLKKGLLSGIEDMEKIMKEYSIPFPVRPPAGINTVNSIEDFSDKIIYEGLFEGIQSFFFVLASGFMNSTSPKIRNAIKGHLILTIQLQELIVEYGKLKGFLNAPPVYRA
jgi:spore coat protein CotF